MLLWVDLDSEEKRREAQVKLKMQAMALAKQQLARAVPNAVNRLQEVAFPDRTLLRVLARPCCTAFPLGCVVDRTSL